MLSQEYIKGKLTYPIFHGMLEIERERTPKKWLAISTIENFVKADIASILGEEGILLNAVESIKARTT